MGSSQIWKKSLMVLNCYSMKKFIGTKEIEAEPMSMGKAYDEGLLQVGRVPKATERMNPGYKVKYHDGYVSWSPAEPFNKSYRLSDSCEDRLKIEILDLERKYQKLSDLIESPKFEDKIKDNEQRKLMVKQHHFMHEYLSVLYTRLGLMQCDNTQGL